MPSRAPSIGTCFALAVVLAAVAALTIPRAGADVVNELVDRLTAENETLSHNDEAGEDHDRAPRLRQPSGWDDRRNPEIDPPQVQDSPQQQSDTNNQTQNAPPTNLNQQPPGDPHRDAPAANQAVNTVAPWNGELANNGTNSENGTPPGNGVSQASGGTAEGTSNQPNEPAELPEVLTRDWSDAPNRSLMSRSELSASSGEASNGQKHTLLDSLMPAASGLAIVIGLFLLCTWMLRKKLPKLVGALPSDVFEVLGKTSLDKKHKLHLVRCGGKLALLSVSTAGIETLMEIDQPDEVTRITGMCNELRSGSSTADFREVLSELNNEPARGWSKRGNVRRGNSA